MAVDLRTVRMDTQRYSTQVERHVFAQYDVPTVRE
jgi:hypothetical protein